MFWAIALFMVMRRKGVVSGTLSEIVDLAVEDKGSKKALAELLSPEMHQNLLQSLRVPD